MADRCQRRYTRRVMCAVLPTLAAVGHEIETMPEKVSIGNCPKCGGTNFRCAFNHFAREDLTIESWEHKCTDCGFRETKAYRSDQPQEAGVDPAVCPFCGRRSVQNG